MIRCLQPFFKECVSGLSLAEGRKGIEMSLCFRELALIALNLSSVLQSKISIHFLSDSKNIHTEVITVL